MILVGFVVGLIAGGAVGIVAGFLLANTDDAYKRGLHDSDRGWKASLSKDMPFRCNAIPLVPSEPQPKVVVKFPDIDCLKKTAR
jgi:hypothetical protein